MMMIYCAVSSKSWHITMSSMDMCFLHKKTIIGMLHASYEQSTMSDAEKHSATNVT